MDKYEENEQWKHGGDCKICRRKNYCSKSCSIHSKRKKMIIRNAVTGLMSKYMCIDDQVGKDNTLNN